MEQAKSAMASFSKALDERIRSAYNWVVYPYQKDTKSAHELAQTKINDTGGDSMAQRVGSQLATAEQLIDVYGAESLGDDIFRYLKSAFKDGMLSVGEVWGYITRFPYMPRLADREVFDRAIEDAPNHPMEPSTRFALASGYDAETKTFRNLIIPGVTPQSMTIQVTDSTLFVDWDVATAANEQAMRRMEAERASHINHAAVGGMSLNESKDSNETDFASGFEVEGVPTSSQPAIVRKKRYYASVDLDPETLNRQLAQLNEAIIDQLRMGRARISMSLDIQAENADGFDDGIMNIINENARNLKNVRNSEFEEE